MLKTYREIAIEQMIVTVEEAMSQVLDYWGDLPPSMKEAVELQTMSDLRPLCRHSGLMTDIARSPCQ
jgi:hypothetical protein